MGKHEPMSAKAIANKIKAKGLQKIKYYCEMCKKQCRDANGFKCHIASESHNRQAAIVSEDPEKFVSEFSKQFMDGFMYILRTRYRTKRILANTIFQEYIKERDHIHMNGTRWTTLTEFAQWLGENGLVKVDDSERGVMVTYIDKDPETLRRQELEARKEQQRKEAAEKNQKEIERQREATKKLLEDLVSERPPAEPIPILTVAVNSSDESQAPLDSLNQVSSERDMPEASVSNQNFVERPVFKVQPISLKKSSSTSYKPPPPKRKVCGKHSSLKKKSKVS